MHNHQQCLYNVIKDTLSKNLFLHEKDVVYKLNFAGIFDDQSVQTFMRNIQNMCTDTEHWLLYFIT